MARVEAAALAAELGALVGSGGIGSSLLQRSVVHMQIWWWLKGLRSWW